MMAANLLNARLVMRVGTDRLFRIGTLVAALAGIALAVDARFGWGGLPGLVVPLFCYVSMLGFIVANSVAGALAAFPHKAGAASALVGALHCGSGIVTRRVGRVACRWHAVDHGRHRRQLRGRRPCRWPGAGPPGTPGVATGSPRVDRRQSSYCHAAGNRRAFRELQRL